MKLHLSSHDPLSDGLREEILLEQNEEGAFNLSEDLNGIELDQQLDKIVQDLHSDPTWFDFAE